MRLHEHLDWLQRERRLHVDLLVWQRFDLVQRGRWLHIDLWIWRRFEPVERVRRLHVDSIGRRRWLDLRMFILGMLDGYLHDRNLHLVRLHFQLRHGELLWLRR
jgi:hypothetical protein